VNEASNPTLGITCLILYELNLVLLSHDPLLDFSEIFLLKNHEFVNFESDSWICNPIHGLIDWTKFLTNAQIDINTL
jgi:hypothetical protein